LKINNLHLEHNYFTDIITFDLSELPNQIIGEIYISTDRVKENASLIGVTINEELHRVIIHGVLHLCGYKDKTAKQKKDMRLLENKYLQKYFK
jgi:rRNA maturation RNase YbeY